MRLDFRVQILLPIEALADGFDHEIAFRKEMDESIDLSKKLEDLGKKGTAMSIVNLKEDLGHINEDTSLVTKNNNWIKNLQKDIFISETVNIINDMAKNGMRVNIGMGMK